MDTDSCYLAKIGDWRHFSQSAKLGLRQVHDAEKNNWLATTKFSEITPGLFKPKFLCVA